MHEFNEGEFCWIDLGSTDVSASKEFFEKVFQWTYGIKIPMDHGDAYQMFQVEGVDAGGIWRIGEQADKIKSSHFMNYFYTGDLEGTAQKAESLGATLLVAPVSVQTYGKMAVLEDPTGAPFALWQATENNKDKAPPQGAPGKVGWRELWTDEPEVAGRFYSQLFGYTLNKPKDTYTIFMLGDSMEGGMVHISERVSDMPSHWASYFNTVNLKETMEAIVNAGGKILEVNDKLLVGQFAIAQDPAGALFCTIQFSGM